MYIIYFFFIMVHLATLSVAQNISVFAYANLKMVLILLFRHEFPVESRKGL
jgi:hypothetical protein